jgi:methylmalonyl-CoA/ethylmalonyl-CoA epimerase
MIIRNERVDHAFRLAGTQVGDFRLELIEPLDDRCVYAEFLKEHGEGLHHVGFTVDNYDEATAFFQGKGIGVLHGGTWHGTTYAYLESEDTLSFIAEIDRRPEGWEEPAPEATYP